MDLIRNDLIQTTEIMKGNIQQLIIRGENLEKLEEKTQLLQSTSSRFKQSTTTLKRKFWWAKNKTRLLLGSITIGTVAATAVIVLI